MIKIIIWIVVIIALLILGWNLINMEVINIH
jgi:hypothetical protein